MFRVGGVLVRRACVADGIGIVELGRIVDSNVLTTPATMQALLEAEAAPTTERLVGERRGRIVAWAPSGLYESGTGWFWIGVHLDARRRGIARAIYGHVEARLREHGATRLETTPNDEQGRRFLTARGFVVSTSVRVSEIDPRRVDASALPPAGVEVVALHEALGQANALFELYSQGRADVPSRAPRTAWTYSEWRSETLDHPLLDLDASTVVLEGGEPVSFAWLYSDRQGRRAETLMAATRRDRRGRGLATLAKIHSARRAAARGITRILTSNDIDNEPMLAINKRLGYTPTVAIESYAKSL